MLFYFWTTQNFNYKLLFSNNIFNYKLFYFNKNFNHKLFYFSNLLPQTNHLRFLLKNKFLLFSFSTLFFKTTSFFFFLNKLNFFFFQFFFFKNAKFFKNFFFFLKIKNVKCFIIDKFYKKFIKNTLISLKIVFYELKFLTQINLNYKTIIWIFNYWLFLFKFNTLKQILKY